MISFAQIAQPFFDFFLPAKPKEVKVIFTLYLEPEEYDLLLEALQETPLQREVQALLKRLPVQLHSKWPKKIYLEESEYRLVVNVVQALIQNPASSIGTFIHADLLSEVLEDAWKDAA